MNTTPYTDDQILEAIEKAMDTTTSRNQLFVREVEDRQLYWEAQREARLQIGKKFLELLSKPQPEPDPYAELKAAYKAGKTIQFNIGKWNNPWSEAVWEDRSSPVFDLDATLYRVKPEPAQAQSWTPAVGDTVQLKSGGPKMTVTRVDGSTITCVWFNQSQNERTACFAVELLEQA